MAGEAPRQAPAPSPPPAGDPPRVSGLLLGSLVLSAVSLALPTALGPLGPLAAGVLAFLGHRRVRASPGAVRGPRIAAFAMTVALVLFVVEAWTVVRHAPSAAAWTAVRDHVERVDANLRSGTPEGAWDLLSPDARSGLDRAAFVGGLREVLSALGPLESLGEVREGGGDWERTGSFGEGEGAALRLPMTFDARFRNGPGLVDIEVVVRREGRAVAGGLERLRVARR